MKLRPEQANFDNARRIHAILGQRLLKAGEVREDGSRRLERHLPNGLIALLHDYTSLAHVDYAVGSTSHEDLLRTDRAILGCEVLGTANPGSRLNQTKPVFIYQPHSVNPESIVGLALRPAAELTPEGEYLAAFKLSNPPRMIPLLIPAEHDTIKQFVS